MHKFAAVLFAAIVSLVVVHAGDDGKADCRGTIMKVTDLKKKAGVLGTILVDGRPNEKNVEYNVAVVKITDKTKIEKLVGKERKPAKFEDLKKGAKVQARFTGPVAESYPVQAAAKEVLILDEGK